MDRMFPANCAKKLDKYRWGRRQSQTGHNVQSSSTTRTESTKNVRKQKMQVESPSSSSKITDSSTTFKLQSHVLLSIVEGRGPSLGVIGIATIDIYRANVELSQFRDTSSYSRTLVKLLVYCPAEILLPRSGLEPNSCMRKLVKLLQSLNIGATFNGVNRSHFNDTNGLDYLRRLCHPYYIPSIYAIGSKFYALSALSALFNYAEEMYGIMYAPRSMKFAFTGSVKSTMIDVKSAYNLLLVRNRRSRSSKGSLYAAVDYTCTAIGARLLRTNLLEPPCDLPTILNRQASVHELISSPETLYNIQQILRQFPNIDSLLSLCVQICSPHKIFNPRDKTDNSSTETSQVNKSSSVESSQETNSCQSKPTMTNTDNNCTPTTKNESLLIHTGKTRSSDLQCGAHGKHSRSTHPLHQPSTSSNSESNYGNELIHIKKAVSVQAAESRITKVIGIKYMLDLVKLLYSAMGDVNSALLKTYKMLLQDPEYDQVLETLCSVLHKDVRMSKGMLAMRTQKIFAIKEGLSALLDVTRQAYAEQLDDITSEVNRLARHYDLPLRLSHTKARGFYIQIPEDALKNYKKPSSPEVVHEGSSASNHDSLSNENKFSDENDDDSQNFRRFSPRSESNKGYCSSTNTTPKKNDSPLQNLPDEFIVLITSRRIVQCTTETLIRLNERIKGCLFEVYHVSDQIICDLITRLHPDMALFYRISEVVASLDLLASFARMSMSCSARDHFVYPIFTDVLGIKNGRNIITAQKRRSLCIANHTYASAESNFHIITGPPMSGKTTYLRQIAYIQILAQIGCLVPAEFAAVRIADHIFYHKGGKDNLMLGESSFTNEIRGLRYILQNFSRSSIILIDGLCHNTNPDEARHLNIAICEALLQHKAFTFFASSRHEMTFLTSVYPNVENYYFSIHEESINDDYRGHHTVDLDSSATSSVNCSTLTIESPLVHSFSETHDSSRIKKWRNYSGLLASYTCDSTRITFTYKLVKGKPPKVLYAVELAKHFAVPQKVLDRAEELLRMYISEQSASDGNRILMPGMHKDAKNADKNSYSPLKGVRKQVMKTDLDETTSTSFSHATRKSDSNNDEKNQEILSVHLSAIDRLENELYRQLEMISKAYENMNTMRHLSDSEKDKIKREIENYIQFLSCRYNAVLNKSNNEEEDEEDDDDDDNEENEE